jgi:hypothetical protein
MAILQLFASFFTCLLFLLVFLFLLFSTSSFFLFFAFITTYFCLISILFTSLIGLLFNSSTRLIGEANKTLLLFLLITLIKPRKREEGRMQNNDARLTLDYVFSSDRRSASTNIKSFDHGKMFKRRNVLDPGINYIKCAREIQTLRGMYLVFT